MIRVINQIAEGVLINFMKGLILRRPDSCFIFVML